MYDISDWTAVKRDNVHITWDLEGTPLQIKTDSVVGSDEEIHVRMFAKNGIIIGRVGVKFSSTMKGAINFCTVDYPDLPVQPPKQAEKVWTISKTESAIIITCNGVEVLNYLFADSSISDCVPRWGGDVVERIVFRSYDTASEFYRAGNAYLADLNTMNQPIN